MSDDFTLNVFVPVECQNGHHGLARIEIRGIEATYKGVPEGQNCKCPKWHLGEGWKTSGKPYVLAPQPAERGGEVDLEALKKPVPAYGHYIDQNEYDRTVGWNACLDYLNTNRIAAAAVVPGADVSVDYKIQEDPNGCYSLMKRSDAWEQIDYSTGRSRLQMKMAALLEQAARTTENAQGDN